MARTVLTCPRCGLAKAVPAGENEAEHCPRCLARSGGALSVYLSAAKPRERRSPLMLAERLLRLGRAGQWART